MDLRRKQQAVTNVGETRARRQTHVQPLLPLVVVFVVTRQSEHVLVVLTCNRVYIIEELDSLVTGPQTEVTNDEHTVCAESLGRTSLVLDCAGVTVRVAYDHDSHWFLLIVKHSDLVPVALLASGLDYCEKERAL